MRRFIPFLMALGALVGCGVWVGVWRAMKPAASIEKIENRASTRIAAEDIAKSHILNSSSDPKSVEFASWGPHITKPFPWPKGLAMFMGGKPDEPTTAIRVVCRGKNQLGAMARQDMILFIQNGKVAIMANNTYGDDYAATLGLTIRP